jgi:hypothetical protein
MLTAGKQLTDNLSVPDEAIVMLNPSTALRAGSVKHLAGYAMFSTVAFIEIFRYAQDENAVR